MMIEGSSSGISQEMHTRGFWSPLGTLSSTRPNRKLYISLALVIFMLATYGMHSAPTSSIRILIGGDVILGRGIDQLLPFGQSNDPTEPYKCTEALKVKLDCTASALEYIDSAQKRNGPFPVNSTINAAYPWGNLLEDMDRRAPDARMFLMTSPITTATNDKANNPQTKLYHHRLHPSHVSTLKASKADVYFLAGNHIMDFTEQGLVDSIDNLEKIGIQYTGGGRTLSDAIRPAIVQLPSQKGRLLAWSVVTYSAGVGSESKATESKPGVLVFEKLSSGELEIIANLIKKYKRPGDVVVLSIHWGSNFQSIVSETHIEFAHSLISQAGVDIVAGSSAHHLMGGEVFMDKLILYGMGDLINDTEGRCKKDSKTGRCLLRDARAELGAAWYIDVDSSTGKLKQLVVKPTKIKHFSITEPDPVELDYAHGVLQGNFTILCNNSGYECRFNDDYSRTGDLVLQFNPL